MARLRSVGCALLLGLSATGIALVAVEIGLRLFAPQALLHDPDAFVPDAELGARLKPGFSGQVVTPEFVSTWSINADGYRGPRAGERGAFAHRVVALGDSFTFGYGVDEDRTWPRVMESRLNAGRAPDDRVEVLNLAVGGYGTWQEALWLERMAPKLRPDMALVAFYVGNDPADNARTVPADGAPAAALAGIGGASRAENLKRWLGSHLHLYELVSDRCDELLVRLGLRQLVYPFELELLMPEESPEVAEGWRATRVSLARLADVSRRSGVPVIVVIVPMKHQISDRFWGRVRTHYDVVAPATRAWDRDRPQRLLAEMLASERLAEIDLLEGLRKAAESDGDGAVFYWPRDQHWTPRGHEAAARLIAEAVAARL